MLWLTSVHSPRTQTPTHSSLWHGCESPGLSEASQNVSLTILLLFKIQWTARVLRPGNENCWIILLRNQLTPYQFFSTYILQWDKEPMDFLSMLGNVLFRRYELSLAFLFLRFCRCRRELLEKHFYQLVSWCSLVVSTVPHRHSF